MNKDDLNFELKRLRKMCDNVKGTRCEVWSRVVGYFRPIQDYNEGKLEEYNDRVEFEIDKNKFDK